MQNVDIAADVRRKRSESVLPGQFYNPHRCVIQHLFSGLVDLDQFQAPIRLYTHGQLQASIKLLSFGCLRVVKIPDAFHFEAPILNVTRKAVVLGARPDEFAFGRLLVGVIATGSMSFQPGDLKAALNQISRIADVLVLFRLNRKGIRWVRPLFAIGRSNLLLRFLFKLFRFLPG